MAILPLVPLIPLLLGLQTPPTTAPKPPCRIGAYFAPIQAGLVVSGVGIGSPAEKAGLKAGDVIIGVDSFQSPNGVAINAFMTGMVALKGCGSEWSFQLVRDGQKMQLIVPINEYLDPLEVAPFIAPHPVETKGTGCFSTVDDVAFQEVLTRIAGWDKVAGEAIYDYANFKGEYAKGFWSELLIGKQIKKPNVYLRFYTPKMALADELYKKKSTFEDFTKEEILRKYGKMNLFYVLPDVSGSRDRFVNDIVRIRGSLQGTGVVRVVIKDGDKIIRPMASSYGKFWFTLDSLPKDHPVQMIVVDFEGAQAIFAVDPKKLSSKGIL